MLYPGASQDTARSNNLISLETGPPEIDLLPEAKSKNFVLEHGDWKELWLKENFNKDLEQVRLSD